MSDYFKVVSSTGGYTVEIGLGLVVDAITSANTDQQIIICDQFFAPRYQALGLKTISVEATEAAKSLDKMTEVIIALRCLGANRSTTLLAVGGGVIQDIATFVASVYMRGLTWHYLPTTLLGMVDSCIGGKSSINVGNYKNLIGNFYPPQSILVDLQFIETLNTEQRIAGLCEAVKICFAHTGDAFDAYIALNPDANSTPEQYQQVISLCLRTKRWFIEIDEYDHKERLLLNFGHTFGHAIEGAVNFAIPHGIAVGMGMLAAIAYARLIGQLEATPQRVAKLETCIWSMLKEVPELPHWASTIAANELMDRFNADKKHSSTNYVVIVPNAEGQLVRLELPKSDANSMLIFKAFGEVCQACSRTC